MLDSGPIGVSIQSNLQRTFGPKRIIRGCRYSTALGFLCCALLVSMHALSNFSSRAATRLRRDVAHEAHDESQLPAITFFGKSWCSSADLADVCSNSSSKPCTPLSDECYFNSAYGVARVSCDRWYGAQKTEKVTWDERDTADDRNAAHSEAFNSYDSLPSDLGHLVELGSGPFTQSKTILSSTRNAQSITLIEPLALHYMERVKKCFYQHGQFSNIPTTLLSMDIESMSLDATFDTVVMINVIEHVYDAFDTLNRAISLVKPGGYLIWHERLWNEYVGIAEGPHDREFQLHPIRLKSAVVEAILPSFETRYLTYDTKELRRLKNEGFYFIGRRTRNPLPFTQLPEHPRCFAGESLKYGATAVLVAGKSDCEKHLQELHDAKTISQVILVLKGASADRLRLEKYKSKLRTVVSGHDDWQLAVDTYAGQCDRTASTDEIRTVADNLNSLGAGKKYTVCFDDDHARNSSDGKLEDRSDIFNLLGKLNSVITRHAQQEKVYGNVYNGDARDQVESYVDEVKRYVDHHDVKHVCEIGFAGGHSATVLLHATADSGARYTAFDMWDRSFYEDSALDWVTRQFPDRQIQLVKGDSTVTVPAFNSNLSCDIIHVDGAHHAHYPKTDYVNMQRLASSENLLLIDDCTASWPAVMSGVDFCTKQGIFTDRPRQIVPDGWSHRGMKKGWCIGSYAPIRLAKDSLIIESDEFIDGKGNVSQRAKTTLVLMSFTLSRVNNLKTLFLHYGMMSDTLDRIVFIWNNVDASPPDIPKTDVEIVVWLAEENSMVNRYRVDSHVRTSSVLTVDDDVQLSGLLIKKMIETHERLPLRLIGLDARGYSMDGKYFYEPKSKERHLLVIGKTMIWNKRYAQSYISDQGLVSYTETHPCEDVGMNFLIRNETNQEPIIIEITDQEWRKDLDQTDGLSVVVSQRKWTHQRHECIEFMLDHFSVTAAV